MYKRVINKNKNVHISKYVGTAGRPQKLTSEMHMKESPVIIFSTKQFISI